MWEGLEAAKAATFLCWHDALPKPAAQACAQSFRSPFTSPQLMPAAYIDVLYEGMQST